MEDYEYFGRVQGYATGTGKGGFFTKGEEVEYDEVFDYGTEAEEYLEKIRQDYRDGYIHEPFARAETVYTKMYGVPEVTESDPYTVCTRLLYHDGSINEPTGYTVKRGVQGGYDSKGYQNWAKRNQ